MYATAAHPQLGGRAVDAPAESARGADVGALLADVVAADHEQRRRLLLHVLPHQLHHLGDRNVLLPR